MEKNRNKKSKTLSALLCFVGFLDYFHDSSKSRKMYVRFMHLCNFQLLIKKIKLTLNYFCPFYYIFTCFVLFWNQMSSEISCHKVNFSLFDFFFFIIIPPLRQLNLILMWSLLLVSSITIFSTLTVSFDMFQYK